INTLLTTLASVTVAATLMAATAMATESTQAQRDHRYFKVYNQIHGEFGNEAEFTTALKTLRDRYRDAYLAHTYDFSSSPWVTPEVREAWIQGYTGRGVTIEIRDDYVRRHPTIPSHGEGVELIISGGQLGETRFAGIAPDATIIRNRKIPGHYSDTVDIVNESNSSPVPSRIWANSIEAVQDANDAYYLEHYGPPLRRPRWFVHTDKVMDFKSAGNRANYTCLPGGKCTGSSISYLATDRTHADNVMLVGGLRRGANISARAGITRDYYMVDHTSYLFGWVENGVQRRRELSGSSAAVPTASAKAALIRCKFPTMNGPQILSLMKRTGHDMGATGVDNHWGCGRVNLTRALAEGSLPQTSRQTAAN
ncbi:MAG: S8 family serine peptidase, partial [Desulfovibrionales bacterium]|nr:S8 family serine peptidase [Desulfovibrionales bacterium]